MLDPWLRQCYFIQYKLLFIINTNSKVIFKNQSISICMIIQLKILLILIFHINYKKKVMQKYISEWRDDFISEKKRGDVIEYFTHNECWNKFVHKCNWRWLYWLCIIQLSVKCTAVGISNHACTFTGWKLKAKVLDFKHYIFIYILWIFIYFFNLHHTLNESTKHPIL